MELDRRDSIVRLLRGRDDHLPVLVAKPASRVGFVHRTRVRVSCEDCLANGRVIPGCETCRGRGYVEVVRSRDPYDTGKHLALAGEKHEARRERDRMIQRLGEQVAPVAEVSTGMEAWELERARRWARFDFAALDVALERLRSWDLDGYHVLMAGYVYGWVMIVPGSVAERAAERALGSLDAMLPDPLRVPGVVVDRDALIRRRAREGVPTRELAVEFGLSVSRVNRIVAAGAEEGGEG